MSSNVGKWNNWYKDIGADPSSFRYGDTVTYIKGASFLSDCKTVEDWGTGAGGFKRFLPYAIGVDGSNTLHAEKKMIDLVKYQSKCEGVFIRHVLEHNYEWQTILRNALTSASKKLCVVIFTPLSKNTFKINDNDMHGVDVPDLSLSWVELFQILFDYKVNTFSFERINSDTGYFAESVLYIKIS